MFARLQQLARHLSRPLPNYLHNASLSSAISQSAMSSPSISAMAASNSKKTIHTAACLVIGDEVLGGKTIDTNSAFFAKFCFSLGITLKRIEVIADDESEIIEAARRMSATYDFVVTSGGIGPTHDDITYPSLAKAFNLPLILHEGAFERMKELSKAPRSTPTTTTTTTTSNTSGSGFEWDIDSPQRRAKFRMLQLPYDTNLPDSEQVLFVSPQLWVPITIIAGNIYVLPGIPRLFEQLLTGLKAHLLPRLLDPKGNSAHRILFSTPLPESDIADFLTRLSDQISARGVKVGSYPRWGKTRNTVTLVGKDAPFMESLVPQVEKGVQGRRVQYEGEDDDDDNKNNIKNDDDNDGREDDAAAAAAAAPVKNQSQ